MLPVLPLGAPGAGIPGGGDAIAVLVNAAILGGGDAIAPLANIDMMMSGLVIRASANTLDSKSFMVVRLGKWLGAGAKLSWGLAPVGLGD